MLTHDQIESMSPQECWRELQATSAVLPLLIAKAGAAGAAAIGGDANWLTAQEVARRLNVSAGAVRIRATTDIRWKEFSKKFGKAWRFKRFEFERYVNEGRSRDL